MYMIYKIFKQNLAKLMFLKGFTVLKLLMTSLFRK